MQIAMVAAGFTPGEADGLRRAMAAWKRRGGLEPYRERLLTGMAANGYTSGICRADLQADPRLRRIRLSGIARRLVRAADLRLLLAQVPRAGGLRRGADQQPAHGLLRPRAAHAGRAPQRRHGIAGGRDRQRLGLHARARGTATQARHCAWGCGWCAGCPAEGRAHRAGARAGAVRSIEDSAVRAQLAPRSAARWQPPARCPR